MCMCKYAFQVEVVDVIKRLLGGRFTVWKRKKERRLEKRAKAKEKKIKEWVKFMYTCTCTHYSTNTYSSVRAVYKVYM